MDLLFGITKRTLCPYCLCEIRYRKEITICPNCKSDLPPEYVQKFSQFPPCFAQIVGWSRVGKTVYLQALTAILAEMNAVWRRNYYSSAQTNPTLRYTRNVKDFMKTGQMPDLTQLSLQDAYIMLLNGMERWGSRSFVMRDVAGEHFNDLVFDIKVTPYLLHVPTFLMMFSLHDLEKQNYAMDQLMNTYIQTLIKHDKDYRKAPRNAVIVLSKADLLVDRLPDSLKSHLQQDPFIKLSNPSVSNTVTPMGGAQMQAYMDSISNASKEIEDWVASSNPGRQLIALASNNGIDLRFTLISSTGGPVGDDKKANLNITPTRVLDPFFWALEFQSKAAS